MGPIQRWSCMRLSSTNIVQILSLRVFSIVKPRNIVVRILCNTYLPSHSTCKNRKNSANCKAPPLYIKPKNLSTNCPWCEFLEEEKNRHPAASLCKITSVLPLYSQPALSRDTRQAFLLRFPVNYPVAILDDRYSVRLLKLAPRAFLISSRGVPWSAWSRGFPVLNLCISVYIEDAVHWIEVRWNSILFWRDSHTVQGSGIGLRVFTWVRSIVHL